MFQVYCKMIQLYIYFFFFKFFSDLGYYKILSRVPCAYTLGPCWSSILDIAVCMCPSQTPSLSLPFNYEVEVKVAQSCLTLCNPMDYTVHGIPQARILEWVAFPSSRGSSQPTDQTQVPCIAGGFLTSWAIREAYLTMKFMSNHKWWIFSQWTYSLNSLLQFSGCGFRMKR